MNSTPGQNEYQPSGRFVGTPSAPPRAANVQEVAKWLRQQASLDSLSSGSDVSLGFLGDVQEVRNTPAQQNDSLAQSTRTQYPSSKDLSSYPFALQLTPYQSVPPPPVPERSSRQNPRRNAMVLEPGSELFFSEVRHESLNTPSRPTRPALTIPRTNDLSGSHEEDSKFLTPDDTIPEGEIRIGTELIPIAQAQARRASEQAEYLRRMQESHQPTRGNSFRRLATRIRRGSHVKSSSNRKVSSSAQEKQEEKALVKQPSPPPERLVVGNANRNTRMTDFLNVGGALHANPLASHPPVEYRPESRDKPLPPTPMESPERVRRRSVVRPAEDAEESMQRVQQVRRRPILRTVEDVAAACPCPEHMQEAEQQARVANQDSSPPRPVTSGLNSSQQASEDENETLTPPQAHQTVQSFTSFGMSFPDALSTPRLAPRQPVTSLFRLRAPYANPDFSASTNQEVNRLRTRLLEEPCSRPAFDDEDAGTPVIDTFIHDDHTSIRITEHVDENTIISRYGQDQRRDGGEVSRDQATEIWERLQTETGGCIQAPASRRTGPRPK